jgi:hypothetical protein
LIRPFGEGGKRDASTRYALGELKISILANGYIPMERVIVVPYRHAVGLYLVVEGNRRIAALKSILRDHDEGVLTLSKSQIANFSRIPVAVLEESGEELTRAERVIMGIRHITGPRPWGAYQRAQFILEMVEQEGQDFEAIAKHLGLSKMETSRRYRAIKALKAMQEDEMYASVANPDLYNLFHELVANPDVRKFFSWNHELVKFDDQERARQFFELIAPADSDQDAKIKTYIDVRKLRTIVGNPLAEAALFDPDQSLASAL